MLKFAILQKVENNGQEFYRPILEGQDGELKREITSRVKRILGPKKGFTIGEIVSAISSAFEEYKKDFKEKTVKLP